jgi:hypothetical protein
MNSLTSNEAKLKAAKDPDGSSLFDHITLAYGSNIQSHPGRCLGLTWARPLACYLGIRAYFNAW